MAGPAIRTLFFDAVGTLFGLRQEPGMTYAEFARHHGIDVDTAAAAAGFRRTWRSVSPPSYEGIPDAIEAREAVDRRWWSEVVRESLRLAGASPEEEAYAACFDEIFAYYGTAAPWRAFSETKEVLARLQNHYRLVVLSNFDHRLLNVMDGLGLTPLIHEILYSAALGASKPSVQVFEQALKAVGAEASQTLHIGDDLETDGAGAIAAGLRFFHVQRPEIDLRALEIHLRTLEHSPLQALK